MSIKINEFTFSQNPAEILKMAFDVYKNFSGEDYLVFAPETFIFDTQNKPFTKFMNENFDVKFYKNFPIMDESIVVFESCGIIDFYALADYGDIGKKGDKGDECYHEALLEFGTILHLKFDISNMTCNDMKQNERWMDSHLREAVKIVDYKDII